MALHCITRSRPNERQIFSLSAPSKVQKMPTSSYVQYVNIFPVTPSPVIFIFKPKQ